MRAYCKEDCSLCEDSRGSSTAAYYYTVEHIRIVPGKVSNPYHKVAIVNLVVRKYNTKTLTKNIVNTLTSSKYASAHFQTKTLFYKASLHAEVRRRRDAPKYLNNNHNQNLTLCSKPNKLQPLTSDISCRTRMTGQGKGTARILTEDPDFVMLDTSSPPQGKRGLEVLGLLRRRRRPKQLQRSEANPYPRRRTRLHLNFG